MPFTLITVPLAALLARSDVVTVAVNAAPTAVPVIVLTFAKLGAAMLFS
jgi:hypothetical protein